VATAGLPYTTIGNVRVDGADPAALRRTLLAAGWTDRADSARINGFAVVLLMWLLIFYLTMVYGPMAAFMVELF
ncbi:hypothetical protein, partial [Escherichia coli]|nr:MFS transporter [Escherichia coli]